MSFMFLSVILYIIAESLLDVTLIQRNIQIDHTPFTFWKLWTIACLLVVLSLDAKVFAAGMSFFLGVRWLLKDWIMNAARGLDFWYLGDPENPNTALSDKILSRLPKWGQLGLKVLVALWGGLFAYWLTDDSRALDWMIDAIIENITT